MLAQIGSLYLGPERIRQSVRDYIMVSDPIKSLQNLRAILERVLLEAEEANMPIVAAMLNNAIASLPDEDH